MNEIRFALAGAGNIGGVHAQALAEIPAARLVAVYSRNLQRACALAGPYHAEGCDDWQAMVRRPDVDAVAVCTPSGAHLEVAVAAAQAGKHVIVEKPLEITLERVDAMLAAARAAGVTLACIFPSRFRPGVQYARRAIQAGRLGRLTLCDAQVKWHRSQEYYDTGGWRGTVELDGGGVLMNQAIHQIDLLQYLAGGLHSVTACSATLAHRMQTEDTAAAVVQFENGALGIIEGSTAAWPGSPGRVEICGERGSIRLEDGCITRWELQDAGAEEQQAMLALEAPPGSGASNPLGIGHIGHLRQLRDFVEALQTGRSPQVDGLEGRKAVEIVCAIYRSAATRQTVTFPL